MEVGAMLAGRFEVVSMLAHGGMSDVIEARDIIDCGRHVAVKLLHEGFVDDPEVVLRFEREARIASTLKSRHVVKIIDCGVINGGRPFIVTELLMGHSLSRELARRVALPIDEAALYVAQACHAMIEAHEAGIVHRDLKPSNLFLCEDGDKRVVKVLDFGIARMAPEQGDDPLTHTKSLFGTPLYMAPESFRSAKASDARSDVWSLGVIFYECITGSVPFHAETGLGVGLAASREPHKPPTERRGGLPHSTDVVLARALKKAPSERYQSVRELMAALELYLPRGRNETMELRAVRAPTDIESAAATERGLGAPLAPRAPLLSDPETNDAPTRIGNVDAHDAPTSIGQFDPATSRPPVDQAISRPPVDQAISRPPVDQAISRPPVDVANSRSSVDDDDAPTRIARSQPPPLPVRSQPPPMPLPVPADLPVVDGFEPVPHTLIVAPPDDDPAPGTLVMDAGRPANPRETQPLLNLDTTTVDNLVANERRADSLEFDLEKQAAEASAKASLDPPAEQEQEHEQEQEPRKEKDADEPMTGIKRPPLSSLPNPFADPEAREELVRPVALVLSPIPPAPAKRRFPFLIGFVSAAVVLVGLAWVVARFFPRAPPPAADPSTAEATAEAADVPPPEAEPAASAAAPETVAVEPTAPATTEPVETATATATSDVSALVPVASVSSSASATPSAHPKGPGSKKRVPKKGPGAPPPNIYDPTDI